MCLLDNNLKIIGMLLNIVRDQVQKKLSKTYNKGFPNHSTLINYVQSHKTLLPRGHVNTKKLVHVLKTCRPCRFINDNQNPTLDVHKLSLCLQEKQTKSAAEITVKWSFTSLYRKATKEARQHIIQVTGSSPFYSYV